MYVCIHLYIRPQPPSSPYCNCYIYIYIYIHAYTYKYIHIPAHTFPAPSHPVLHLRTHKRNTFFTTQPPLMCLKITLRLVHIYLHASDSDSF